MDNVISGLNEAQKAAVTSPAQVLQVLAPPGSGKTKTLTSRVAYLITHLGLTPSKIIVCTFTVKAANEMRDRIEGFLGRDLAGKLKLGTFHSIARRLLSINGHRISLPDKFAIADTSDSKAIIKRIIEHLQVTIDAGTARNRISKLKAEGVTADKYRNQIQSATAPKLELTELSKVYDAYEEHLTVSHLLDYDDLLLRCTELLQRFPQCVAGIDAVLVDEFQDTNHTQYDLMNLFAQSCQRITIVGDPDQSIYGFRSAKIENLDKMRNLYPETHVVNLEENYRSSGCILLAAQEIIEQDKARPQKCLAPTHSPAELPTLRRLYSAKQEAKWIASEIKRVRTLAGGLLNFDDFAILLRTSSLSRLIESELASAAVSYRMVGGMRFYDRVEIKLVLDYLRVIDHADHSDALERVINVPSRKIGAQSIANLQREADSRKMTLWAVVLKTARGELKPPIEGLAAPAMKGIGSFVNLILISRKRLERGSDESLANFMRWFVRAVGLQPWLKKMYQNNEDNETRWNNVQELIAQASEFIFNDSIDAFEGEEDEFEGTANEVEVQMSNTPHSQSLEQFLANIALSTDAQEALDENDSQGRVTLSTIHASKGLEWPVVFIPAVYDGSIPHSRADDHDEERRLLYVAMTRAQGILYMSCTLKDSRNGDVTLSRFLDNKAILRRTAKRGPSLTFDLVRELAGILRRDLKTANTEAARAKLESLEDDQFFDSSERTHRQEGPQDCDDDLEIIETSYSSQVKRKRSSGSTSFSVPKKTQVAKTTTADVPMTTMDLPTSFSTATTVWHIQQENRASCDIEQAERTTKPPVKRQPKLAQGQRNLTGFFTAQPRSAHMWEDNAGGIRPAAEQKQRKPLTEIQCENRGLQGP